MEIFGYEFRNTQLLDEALTTPAYRMQFPQATDNQRLEFLGDAVLGLLAADRLYADLPTAAEGHLTVTRTHMVSTGALCAAAERLGLAALLKRNKGASPLPRDSKTIADAVEAVLGAVWLDGGLPAARSVFETLGLSAEVANADWCDNAKGDLQIRAQAMTPPRHPEYRLLETAGKAHEPIFTVEVAVDGLGSAVASARTHKEAERRAAHALLARIGSRT